MRLWTLFKTITTKMVRDQNNSTFIHKIMFWARRHKVRAALTVIIAAIMLESLSYWIVERVQVHYEQQRFVDAEKQLAEFAHTASSTGNPRIETSHSCSYTSNGAVFATKYLSCDTNITLIYLDVPKTNAQKISTTLIDTLKKQAVRLTKNSAAYEKNDLAIYNYPSKGLECSYVSAWYDADVIASSRYTGTPPNSIALYVNVGCGGAAKAEYFPVTSG